LARNRQKVIFHRLSRLTVRRPLIERPSAIFLRNAKMRLRSQCFGNLIFVRRPNRELLPQFLNSSCRFLAGQSSNAPMALGSNLTGG
jgi:hypothetical protein